MFINNHGEGGVLQKMLENFFLGGEGVSKIFVVFFLGMGVYLKKKHDWG